MRRRILAAIAAIFIFGCRGPTTREGAVIEGAAPPPRRPKPGWSYADTERVTRRLSDRLLASPFARRNLSLRIEVRDETAETIDEAQVRALLRRRLSQTGRFRIVKGDEAPTRNGVALENPELYANPPETRRADYLLIGRLSTEGARTRFELSLLRDGAPVWSEAEEIGEEPADETEDRP